MNFIELFLLAVGLSMDAFAVSVCAGLSLDKATLKNAAIVALYFGFFQAAMPLVGYLVGSQFSDLISAYDHWVAFVLLAFIGGKMIRDSLSQDCESDDGITTPSVRKMLPLAVATSIDALAVGVSFAFLEVSIVPAVSFIGVVTFALSLVGVQVGKAFGSRFKSKAELVGGIILVGMGAKILIEHLRG
ncbi:MAG: manganese efflux pump MntP family protein [Oscillospiraceae bacterium]|jgi:putative Mn2+ efflux pump MntP|nr:manganese efflux pump MntP family protein [Oscillospiraceae bacterium]